MNVEEARFQDSTPKLAATGLLGWVSFVWGGIRLDGVSVRRTAEGELTLSYPLREDRRGRTHPTFRPISDEVRREIEEQVFSQLGLWHLGRRRSG